MFVRIVSYALEGIHAAPVQVEVDASPGIPAFSIVGLPDAAVRESGERVRSALRNSGWKFPPCRITVNLAPAHTRKGGAGFDLAIALGVLAATGQVPPKALEGSAVAAELALDGTLRSVRGALAMALAARALTLILPVESASEAALAGGLVFGATNLEGVVRHLTGRERLPPAARIPEEAVPALSHPDLADVRGQLAARRALEVAAAGGHNLLFMGPPGAGKSMLARCLPSILPPLDPEESLEVSRIHSVAGTLAGGRLIRARPFRSPHHSATRSALLGGGNPLRPGEVTLAHRGVLFLDELPEFGRDALEALRQPLEDGEISISRANGGARFPARPMLVAAANPCPCGYLGDSNRPCTCSSAVVTLYRARLSGPLLDRFDLHLFMAQVPWGEFGEGQRPTGEPSGLVRRRVESARAAQARRLGGRGACNAQMSVVDIRCHCLLPPGGASLLHQAMERFGLSLRGHDRVLRVARTIADLACAEHIELPHLAEALQYRGMERRL